MIATKKIEEITVAQQGSVQFFVPTRGPWEFLIHDRLLIVTSPHLQSKPPGHNASVETVEVSRKAIYDFAFAWLVDKYKTQKDLQLEVHFPGEPLPTRN